MTEHAPRYFHKFATQGSSIATARFEQSDFDAALAEVNQRFGLQIVPPDGLFEELLTGLRCAAGRYWQEKHTIERPAVARRLRRLNSSAKYTALAFQAMDSGLQDGHDLAALQLLADALSSAHPTLSSEEVKSQLKFMREAVSELYFASKDAEAALKAMGNKKGQRGLGWYELFVDVLLHAARVLSIPVTTAGDRTKNPYATPFTVLAYRLEKSLPDGARTKTLATCAKRLQVSLARRKNTSETRKKKMHSRV